MATDLPCDDDPVAGREGIRSEPSAALWTVSRGTSVGICLLIIAPLSAEIRLLVDGRVTVEHRFASPAEATIWANEYRADLLASGWRPAETATPVGPDPREGS